MTDGGEDDVSPQYYNNLNCTWLLEAKKGFYVNFEFEKFWVRQNDAYW